MGLPRPVAIACMTAVCLAAATAHGPLEGIPHVADEIAYTLQSRLFAAGMHTGPAGDNASMLLYPFWQATPASFSVFPPGWPGILALGERMGLAWMVNPLLLGLLPWLTWLLAQELTDKPQATLAATLAALSPGLWVLGASRMAHTSVLVALLGLAVVAKRARDPRWAWGLAGVGLGYVVLARPFDAFVVGLPLALWGAARTKDPLNRLSLAAPTVLALVLLGAHNLVTTGSLTTFAVGPYYDAWVADSGRPPGCNRLGFSETIGCHSTLGSWGHDLGKAAQIAGDSLLRLDRLALGIPGGLVLALVGAWSLGRRMWLPCMILGVAVIGGYALYWSPGMAYGARFYHPLYLALPLLLAAGSTRVLQKFRWAVIAIPLLCAPNISEGLRGYWCVDDGLQRELEAAEVTDAVVFIKGIGTRSTAWPALGVDAFTCTPLLESGDGFHLLNPTDPHSGLQPRHALSDPTTARAYMRQLHPGTAAWIGTHDIQRDQWRLEPLKVD